MQGTGSKWALLPPISRAMILLKFSTAFSTPFPRYRLLSPSRSSHASSSPVDAPLGTAALEKVTGHGFLSEIPC